MAERRMMTKKVTDDDHFVNLSASAQALYLHLNMSADDDGFCNTVNACMFKAHASVEDLKSLLENRYLFQFENGVIVIKHWRMANALRKDRYTPTDFEDEMKLLELKPNGAYTLAERGEVAAWLPSGCQMVATGKDRLGEEKKEAPPRRFTKPTLSEIEDFINENNYIVNATKFFDYYESNGWKVGRNSMKDWKAAVRSWEAKEQERLREKEPKERRLAF